MIIGITNIILIGSQAQSFRTGKQKMLYKLQRKVFLESSDMIARGSSVHVTGVNTWNSACNCSFLDNSGTLLQPFIYHC